jgi:hypothetical protein
VTCGTSVTITAHAGATPTTRSPRRVRPIAAGEYPSAVAKHDKPARIAVDTRLVDRPSDLDIGVPIEDLLDALPALPKKLDRVSCNVGRHRKPHQFADQFAALSANVLGALFDARR